MGINEYSNPANNLKGCVNDVNAWSSMFMDVYHFDEVMHLVNANVTKNKVKSSLRTTIEISKPGDMIVIQYSGHGTYVADRSGDEANGQDEALALYDGYLIDDEIREIVATIQDNIDLVFILDCCFSGTATRMHMDEEDYYKAVKFILSETNTTPILTPPHKICEYFDSSEQIMENKMREILLSGSNDAESAWDASVGGTYHGAMTYFATKILNQTPNITYKELHDKLRTHLPSSKYPQHPQLEGKEENKNQLVFQ